MSPMQHALCIAIAGTYTCHRCGTVARATDAVFVSPQWLLVTYPGNCHHQHGGTTALINTEITS